MKRIKFAIIILAAILIVSGVVFGISYYFNNKAQKETQAESEKLIMFDFDSEDVDKIEINNEDGQYIAEYGSSNGWTLTNTEEFTLNDTIMTSITSVMSNLKASKIIENTDKAKYGFDSPTKITSYIGDTAYTVLIGDVTPTYENFYAMKENDDAIYLIDYTSGLVLDPDKNSLKSTYLYNFSTFDVDHVALWKGSQTDKNVLFSLDKDSSDTWHMNKPSENAQLDLININEFLIASSNDEIYTFVQEDCTEADYSKYGFDNPQYVFEVSSENKNITVIFGKETGNEESEVYALFPESNQVATILLNNISMLNYSTLDIVKTSIFASEINSTAEVSLVINGNECTMDMTEGKDNYKFNGVNVSELGEQANSAFIDLFNSFNNAYLNSEEISASPEGDEEITIEYTTSDNMIIDIGYIPAPDSDKYYSTYNGTYSGYSVDKSVIDNIISSYEKLTDMIN